MNELQKIEPQAQLTVTPQSLITQALMSNASVEVMKGLMDLEERWKKNQAKMAFDAAMAELRKDLPPIIKTQKVDFSSRGGRTNYAYEDLHDVTEALSPVMAKHGLSFRWRTHTGEPVVVDCIVSHSAGHSEESSLSAPRDETGNKNAIQALGSAITYLQRYTLKAALGVAAARDDDGISAGQPRAAQQQARAPQSATKATVLPTEADDATRNRAFDILATEFGKDIVLKFLRIAEVSAWPLADVPTGKRALGELSNRIAASIRDKNDALPVDDGDTLPPEIANVVFHIPPKGVKRADYKALTLGEMWVNRHDQNVAARLFGTMNNFQADGWTKRNPDGTETKMPPSAEDIALRKGLDLLQEYVNQREGQQNESNY